ncbi:hypothetical protein CPC08DRAFT_318027 [Agrocybe pediades]|nr:hypothetical protein CPC08DRAFT_318027 [Agrocybe pediades]
MVRNIRARKYADLICEPEGTKLHLAPLCSLHLRPIFVITRSSIQQKGALSTARSLSTSTSIPVWSAHYM